MEKETESKRSARERADEIKPFRCKNLIAVLENPTDVKNKGTVIRNGMLWALRRSMSSILAVPCPTTGKICVVGNRFQRPLSPP
jgi:hypothetical protein